MIIDYFVRKAGEVIKFVCTAPLPSFCAGLTVPWRECIPQGWCCRDRPHSPLRCFQDVVRSLTGCVWFSYVTSYENLLEFRNCVYPHLDQKLIRLVC